MKGLDSSEGWNLHCKPNCDYSFHPFSTLDPWKVQQTFQGHFPTSVRLPMAGLPSGWNLDSTFCSKFQPRED